MVNGRIVLVMLALLGGCDKKQDAPKPVEAKSTSSPSASPASPASPSASASPAASPAASPTGSIDEPKPQVDTKTDPLAGWKERKGDGFSVMGPLDPQVEKKQLGSLPAVEYTRYVPEGPGALQVIFIEFDSSAKLDPAAMVKTMKDSTVEQLQGKITKEQDISTGGAKGEEVWIEGSNEALGKVKAHVKLLLVKRRFYVVQDLHTADATDFEVQGEKFLSSFKLL